MKLTVLGKCTVCDKVFEDIRGYDLNHQRGPLVCPSCRKIAVEQAFK